MEPSLDTRPLTTRHGYQVFLITAVSVFLKPQPGLKTSHSIAPSAGRARLALEFEAKRCHAAAEYRQQRNAVQLPWKPFNPVPLAPYALYNSLGFFAFHVIFQYLSIFINFRFSIFDYFCPAFNCLFLEWLIS